MTQDLFERVRQILERLYLQVRVALPREADALRTAC